MADVVDRLKPFGFSADGRDARSGFLTLINALAFFTAFQSENKKNMKWRCRQGLSFPFD